jgi:hypothetical protein
MMKQSPLFTWLQLMAGISVITGDLRPLTLNNLGVKESVAFLNPDAMPPRINLSLSYEGTI